MPPIPQTLKEILTFEQITNYLNTHGDIDVISSFLSMPAVLAAMM